MTRNKKTKEQKKTPKKAIIIKTKIKIKKKKRNYKFNEDII